jgi:hypothetical protein
MRCATTYRRPDGWYFHADCRTDDGLWVAGPPYLILPLDASTSTIGETVATALQGSQESVPRPTETGPRFMPMLDLANAQSWAGFMREASCVSIRLDDEHLRFCPSENMRTRKWYRPLPSQELKISANATAEELGQAAQDAHERCK